MKNILLSLIITITTAMSISAAELPTTIPSGNLTMEKACEITLAANPSIAEMQHRINAANDILKQAKSSLLPQVNLSAGSNFMNVAEQPDWEPQYRMEESFNQWTASVGFSWVLFDGFARKANILAAQYGKEQTEQLSYDVKRVLAQSVSLAFLQSQLAMENMAVAAQNQKFNLHLKDQAELRFNAGQSSETEMLNFSLKALQAETDFIRARSSFDIACTILAELMAYDDTDLPTEMYPVRFQVSTTEKNYDYNSEFAYAIDNRPDLLAIRTQILAAEQQVNATKGSYYPTIAAVGGIEYTKTNDIKTIDQDENNKYLGLNLQWNLFSGGRKQAAVAQARNNKLALEESRKSKILDIQSAIQQSIIDLNTTSEVLAKQVQARDLTVRIRSNVEKAYNAGTVSITRLNEAQTDMVAATTAVNAAMIQYKLAEITLNSQTGKIIE